MKENRTVSGFYKIKAKRIPILTGVYEKRFINNFPQERSNKKCWNWSGGINGKGYGIFNHRAKHYQAQRIAYTYFFGKIPDGFVVDHKCRNRLCVNPFHLRAVTNKENVLSGKTIPSRHMIKKECPYGHKYSGVNLGKKEVAMAFQDIAKAVIGLGLKEITGGKEMDRIQELEKEVLLLKAEVERLNKDLSNVTNATQGIVTENATLLSWAREAYNYIQDTQRDQAYIGDDNLLATAPEGSEVKIIEQILIESNLKHYTVKETAGLIVDKLCDIDGRIILDNFSEIKNRAQRWRKRCEQAKKCFVCGKLRESDLKTCSECRSRRYASRKKHFDNFIKIGKCRWCPNKINRKRSSCFCTRCLGKFKKYRPITYRRIGLATKRK